MTGNSTSDQKRKLAAILFADIVGYTALMQKGEGNAMSILNRFQEVTKSEVNKHKGEIIKSYGDGSLILFDSTVDAMQCAHAMQLAFRKNPIVPLRIGIHVGEVVRKDDDIFGNGVNIASRVESMGIAGAVLMTADAQKRIKNQEAFQTQSLGEFAFKNVEEPLEVFALANEGFLVPKREAMQGKGKATSKTSNKLWYVLIPVLLIISAFGIYQWQQPTATSEIVADIQNGRIAVLPFKNYTDQADLDVLGDMSADWINRGLMEIEGVEVTSPFTVRSNLAALGIAPDDPEGRRSFSELTGAQNMLSGNYYEENGDIIFQLQIESATDGNIHFVFDPIRGPKDDKEALLTQLGSQVAGYWVAREMVDSKNIQAPNYEAYVAYNNALLKSYTGSEFTKVFELDSSFYMARLHYLNVNRYGLTKNNNKHFDFLERHVSQLSDYELGWFSFLKGLYSGNAQHAFVSLNKLRKKYPKDFMLNHQTARFASGELNNPEIALAIYNELPIEDIDISSVGRSYNHRFIHQVQSYVKLGQYSELSSFLITLKLHSDIEEVLYHSAMLTKALMENNSDEIDRVYNQFLKVYDYDQFYFFHFSRFYLYSSISSSIRDRVKSDFLSNYQKLDSTNINKTYWKPFFALIKGESPNIPIDDIRKLPGQIPISTLYAEAVNSISNNNKDKTDYWINELMKYTSTDNNISSANGPGEAHYNLGKIFIKMGNTEDAIKHLKESRKFGKSVYLFFYKYDIELASLVGIPEFDAITDPIWPEVKN